MLLLQERGYNGNRRRKNNMLFRMIEALVFPSAFYKIRYEFTIQNIWDILYSFSLDKLFFNKLFKFEKEKQTNANIEQNKDNTVN